MTIGCSIFRRRRGKSKKAAPRWTIELRLPDGRRQRRVGFTDKSATQQLAATMVREIERREMGLHDQFGKARQTSLDLHVEAFLAAQRNGSLGRRRRGARPDETWIARTAKRLRLMFGWLGATRIEHLVVGEAEAKLSERVRSGEWSDKTRDDHAALLRQFGAWLVADLRAPSNPFDRLRATRTQASVRWRRHAMTVEEIGRLAAAAEQRSVQEYRRSNPTARPETLEAVRARGWERGVLYLVAAYTGLRRGEVTALRWADLVLGAEPAIQVRPETAKNRRGARLEVPSWLGELLEQVRHQRAAELGAPPAPLDPVFGASYRHLAERLKLDAVWAGIGTIDGGRVVTPAGLVVDFHCLRGTLATLAAEAGMPAKLLQQQMRHSDIRLTMQVYAQVRAQAMRDEVERLPRPGVETSEAAPGSADSRPSVANGGRHRPGSEIRRKNAR